MKNESMSNNNIIKTAITKLQADIKLSKLSGNEKEALRVLLEKLSIYYDKMLNQITRKGNSDKEIALESFVTDILVEVNSVLTGDNDIYYFVSIINKKLRDKKIDKIVINNKKR